MILWKLENTSHFMKGLFRELRAKFVILLKQIQELLWDSLCVLPLVHISHFNHPFLFYIIDVQFTYHKIHLLQVQRCFSQFTEVCNHHYNPVLEHSHHSPKFPWVHMQVNPTPTPKSPLICSINIFRTVPIILFLVFWIWIL